MSTFCRASLNYLPRTGMGAAGVHETEVEVLDGRAEDLPGWQECGFELIRNRSAVREWSDDAEVSSVHYGEVEELARKMTDADVALVSGHIRRSPEDAERHHQLSPITFVHSDFAANHAELIRRSYLEAGEPARAALARNGASPGTVTGASRILVLQFWRNLGAARMDYPIAFCDARTVSPADSLSFHVTDYAGSGSDFDALAVVEPENPSRHAWYTFPEMTTDEAVAFRTYDTDLVARGLTFFTPHSAFRDPAVPVGEPARRSIELRATCLFL